MSDVNDKRHYKSIPVLKSILTNDIVKLQDILIERQELCNFVYKKSGETPLILAARYKHIDILKLLIKTGADIEHKNLDGKRALHEAATSGCSMCVDVLIQNGAEVDVLKRADWTPLMFASTQGHVDVVKQLIESGANLNRLNKDGWSCFHLACREGFVNILALLISYQETSWDTVSKNGRTPLHTACMNGKIDIVQFLLKTCVGVHIHKQDSCGTTPFMDTIRFNHVDISKLLVNKDVACIYDEDILKRSSLHIAAQSGHLSSIKYLVEQCNVDINRQCPSSLQLPLHFAAKEGHVDALKYIIPRSGSLDCKDQFDRTPLHLSVAANKLEATCLLLRHGSNYNLMDSQGKRPFDYALSNEMKSLNLS